MSRALTFLVAVGLSILVSTGAAAQVIFQMPPAPPPPGQMPTARDAGPQKTGTARIRGRVTAADSGQPLRKAQVRVSAPELRESHTTSTDADGKFEVKDLAAGRYQIAVSKGSFVSLSYGQTRPFEAGKPLQIADGQIVEKVDFALPRGAIVTGHVVDEFGEAIADIRVTPMRYQFVQGRRQLTAAGRVSTTNDIGEYRIFGLAPGQYYISASTQINIMNGLMDVASDDRSGYAPSYYPGTPNVAEAQRINVGLGQALNDINLALTPTHLARISGTAVDSNGKPLGGGVIMVMQRAGVGISNMSGAQVKPDGTFAVANLAPGDYMLTAMTPSAITDMSEMATGQVTVAGEDISGIQLMGVKATTGTGRILVNPEITKSLPPGTIRLMATPAHPEENILAGIGGVTVKDDYTFELKARPGVAIIRAPQLPNGWTLKSVKQRGTDVTDSGIEFRPNEEASGIEIELTNQATEVSGGVTNARNEAVKDYTVIVFSKEREKWGYMSRFFQTGRPDQDGRFKVRSLPAGDYYAVALDYVEPGEASDPEFLDRVKEHAVSLSLSDGETKTIDLKVTLSASH